MGVTIMSAVLFALACGVGSVVAAFIDEPDRQFSDVSLAF
jgi:hypothetical protein